MDQEKVDYIFNYFGKLMTDHEARAWRHYSSEFKLTHGGKKEANERMRNFYLERGLITNDLEVTKLLDNGFDKFKENVVKRILNQNPDKVYFNLCPNCSKLARTPLARQCRYCGYDWH
ncbi:MAG: hypothetical protein AAFQ94_04910 [Bacteroidota bacterium]